MVSIEHKKKKIKLKNGIFNVLSLIQIKNTHKATFYIVLPHVSESVKRRLKDVQWRRVVVAGRRAEERTQLGEQGPSLCLPIYVALLHFKDKAVLENVPKWQFWMVDLRILVICVFLHLKALSKK